MLDVTAELVFLIFYEPDLSSNFSLSNSMESSESRDRLLLLKERLPEVRPRTFMGSVLLFYLTLPAARSIVSVELGLKILVVRGSGRSFPRPAAAPASA